MKTKNLLLLSVVVFGLLFAQLFRLTVLEGRRYRALSEGQRIRERNIVAPRGLIRDRNGEVVARNRPIYKKLKIKSEKPSTRAFDPSSGRGAQAEGLKIGEEEYEIISHEEALRIEAKGGSEAASLRVEIAREYVGGENLAHVIGYTGEVTQSEIRNSLFDRNPASAGQFEIRNYELGDRVGRMGVEEQYDEVLRGVDGKELIETDAKGQALRVLGRIEPEPGQDLTLAIDLSLQKKAAELFQGKTGAVVASKAKSGEVLALFSSPSFDPNLFEDPSTSSGQEVDKILIDPKEPLFNRVISGLYPPGSIFKVITAAAALEEGVINKETEIEDVGMIQIGPYRFGNWFFTQYGKTEGRLDILKAIKRSNDIFFYKVAEWLGAEKLAKWGRKFGIGKFLGIDLPGEGEGLMPDPEWKEKAKQDKWFLGDTYHLAIGQGNLLVTPLQVNFWTGVIANDGKLCRPRVKRFEVQPARFESRPPASEFARRRSRAGSESGGGSKFEECQEIGLKEETISLVKEGMKQACEPGGTGWPLFNFKVTRSVILNEARHSPVPGEVKDPLTEKNDFSGGAPSPRDLGAQDDREIPVGCKTGTAEFGPSTSSGQVQTHAWFTVFAPYEDPEIVVTVLVEGGGEGSYVAAPIAKEILEEWFGR